MQESLEFEAPHGGDVVGREVNFRQLVVQVVEDKLRKAIETGKKRKKVQLALNNKFRIEIHSFFIDLLIGTEVNWKNFHN